MFIGRFEDILLKGPPFACVRPKGCLPGPEEKAEQNCLWILFSMVLWSFEVFLLLLAPELWRRGWLNCIKSSGVSKEERSWDFQLLFHEIQSVGTCWHGPYQGMLTRKSHQEAAKSQNFPEADHFSPLLMSAMTTLVWHQPLFSGLLKCLLIGPTAQPLNTNPLFPRWQPSDVFTALKLKAALVIPWFTSLREKPGVFTAAYKALYDLDPTNY